jgi:hypothetical protein
VKLYENPIKPSGNFIENAGFSLKKAILRLKA